MSWQQRGEVIQSAAVVARALEQRKLSGTVGSATARVLARGAGWSVKDIVCTHNRADRPFEEQHGGVSVALVLAGTFQYRCNHARELLAPGALLLGNPGECFECSHEHAAGDRCVAFHFTPEYFERIASDMGQRRVTFATSRVPPLRDLARIGSSIAADLSTNDVSNWEETALEIAAQALQIANQSKARYQATSPRTIARITESIRLIDANPAAPHTIRDLAAAADIGVYYYLRCFERVAGVTPHQFILRARLRLAATRIAYEDKQIATIAFQSGFGDLSNFNHTFRTEFGVTPRQWRNSKHPSKKSAR